jgi:hypothetical protein
MSSERLEVTLLRLAREAEGGGCSHSSSVYGCRHCEAYDALHGTLTPARIAALAEIVIAARAWRREEPDGAEYETEADAFTACSLSNVLGAALATWDRLREDA